MIETLTTPTRFAAVLFVALAGPAMAQPAPPSEGSSPESKSTLDPKQNNAAKLAGLIGFVNQSCPDQKPDTERFKAVVARLGVDMADLEKGELLMRAMAYIDAYQKDVPGSCARAVANFGEAGTTIPGLIGKR